MKEARIEAIESGSGSEEERSTKPGNLKTEKGWAGLGWERAGSWEQGFRTLQHPWMPGGHWLRMAGRPFLAASSKARLTRFLASLINHAGGVGRGWQGSTRGLFSPVLRNRNGLGNPGLQSLKSRCSRSRLEFLQTRCTMHCSSLPTSNSSEANAEHPNSRYCGSDAQDAPIPAYATSLAWLTVSFSVGLVPVFYIVPDRWSYLRGRVKGLKKWMIVKDRGKKQREEKTREKSKTEPNPNRSRNKPKTDELSSEESTCVTVCKPFVRYYADTNPNIQPRISYNPPSPA